jgi:hypothetical protein
MRGLDLLRMQLLGSCDLVTGAVAEATPHWSARAFPGASRPGFVLWHCARIVDWGVNTVVRGAPEVAARPRWSTAVRHDLGHGAGLADAQADEVAATVAPDDLAAYVRELRAVIEEWVSSLDDADLDRVPDLRAANRAHPLYATAAAWEEVAGLENLPAWQFLCRPCGNHVRVHIGELQVLCQALGGPLPA